MLVLAAETTAMVEESVAHRLASPSERSAKKQIERTAASLRVARIADRSLTMIHARMCYRAGMVSIKEAVERAVAFAQEVLEPPRTTGLRLEETDLGKIGPQDVWFITLSMPTDNPLRFATRDYKTFAVSKQTGEVLSMKIREVARAD